MAKRSRPALWALLWKRLRRVLLVLAVGAAPGCQSPASPVPEVEPTPEDSGTVRMIRRLEVLADSEPLGSNPFASRQRSELGRRRLESLGDRATPRERFEVARAELRGGDTRSAITRLEALLADSDLASDDLPELRRWIALAWLRLAEEENCLEGHGAESCLLPIRGGGHHSRSEGGQRAFEILLPLAVDRPADLDLRWLTNLSAMTVGLYPQRVPAKLLLPPELFESSRDVGRFPDVAGAVGLDHFGLAGGAVVDDLNGDGLLDVLSSSWGHRDPLTLSIATGGGSFEDGTAAGGLEGLTGGLNLVHADYDNDGDNDVLVLRGAWLGRVGRWPNSLLQNQGDGRFVDVTEAAGLLSFRPTQTAAWLDVNNDGWLDLFIGNESLGRDEHPCELFVSDRDGAFTEVGAAWNADVIGYVKGIAAGDFDNDGWVDIYLSRLMGPNVLLRNESGSGRSSFADVAADAGVAEPVHSFPTWFFDVDNDGWQDLFVSGYSPDYFSGRTADVVADWLGRSTEAETPRLYRNLGDGRFADVTEASGLRHVLLGMGANFGDLDNDGYLDLYVGTGAPSLGLLVPNVMYRNDDGRRFEDVTYSGGFGHLQKGHGVAFADLDQDGDQDVYATMGGAYSGDRYYNVLFENPGHGASWITLRLEGVSANRSAIGARVRLDLEGRDGDRSIFRVVGTGGSFGSASLQVEIGLGLANRIKGGEIVWPGSGIQTLDELPLGTIVAVREGEAPRVVHASPIPFSR